MTTALCAAIALLGQVQAPRQIIFDCQMIRLAPGEKLVLLGEKELGSEMGKQLCLLGATQEVVEALQQLVKAEKARVISGPILRSLEGQRAIMGQNFPDGEHLALILRGTLDRDGVNTEAELSDGKAQKDFQTAGESWSLKSKGNDGKDGYRVFVVQKPGEPTLVVTVKTTLVED